MRSLRLAGLCLVLCCSVFASDVTGKWISKSPESPGLHMELKAEGKTLTGTIGDQDFSGPIQNGKIDGDRISFEVQRGERTMELKGTIHKDQIVLNLNENLELTFERAK